jgi:Mesyanzhinovviridae Dda-like helicase
LEWEPTVQQLDALEDIRDWYAGRAWDTQQVYRLFGYAGTGKTSLARRAADALGVAGETLYAAFTGKAAYVLRSKSCVGAQTIHSLIYQPAERTRERLNRLQALLAAAEDATEREELTAEIASETANLSRVSFTLNAASDLAAAELLILDEASMVNAEIGQNLESFGVPILVLGDPMQLPPVEGQGYFTEHRPDTLLDEIHRSEAGSPVTQVATAIRNSAPGDSRFGVHGPNGHSGRFSYVNADDLLNYDQVIVGTNRTRWNVIHFIRGRRGFPAGRPVAGDRIIVLANNSDVGVFNGQQWSVESCQEAPPVPDGTGGTRPSGRFILQVVGDRPAKDAESERRVLTVWSRGFVQAGDKETRDVVNAGRRGGMATATFAQAITCHKSQGSQWNHVLVIDEARVFKDMARRWLYTAATRAARQIVIVGGIKR